MKVLVVAVTAVMLTSCSQEKVPKANNICKFFLDKSRWYWAATKAEQRWHVPVSLIMAVIFQESHFVANALPPRRKLFNLIPASPISTARGYAQATNGTWRLYQMNRRKPHANRLSIEDATDFVGWYISYAHYKLHFAKNDAYNSYLAYHEGVNGFMRHSFRYKFLLKHAASKVKRRMSLYHEQLVICGHTLPKAPWWYK